VTVSLLILSQVALRDYWLLSARVTQSRLDFYASNSFGLSFFCVFKFDWPRISSFFPFVFPTNQHRRRVTHGRVMPKIRILQRIPLISTTTQRPSHPHTQKHLPKTESVLFDVRRPRGWQQAPSMVFSVFGKALLLNGCNIVVDRKWISANTHRSCLAS
jgi:hypothetical protein